MSPLSGRVAFILCIFFVTQVSPAAESVRFLGFEGRGAESEGIPAVFGNREQTIDLEIVGASSPSSTLFADLFQVAGSLALPLAKNVTLQKSLAVADISEIRVSIKFPDVKKRAEVLVRLALVPDKDASKHTLPGDLRFEVFPAETTKDLVDTFQPAPDGAEAVVLFGAGCKLRQFFNAQHVRFEDMGEDVPSNFDPKRVYLGEVIGDEIFQVVRDRSSGSHIAVFSHDESLPPGVYADRSGSGALVHVTTPILDHIADDPRAQIGLIKIFHLLSAPSYSN